jgi:hypothetical protein
VIDPRLAWFVIGATCGAVVFGWRQRYLRYKPTRLIKGITESGVQRGGFRYDVMVRVVRVDSIKAEDMARQRLYQRLYQLCQRLGADPGHDQQLTNPV